MNKYFKLDPKEYVVFKRLPHRGEGAIAPVKGDFYSQCDTEVDIQKLPSEYKIDIDKVGVCDLIYPIVVLDKRNERQTVTATINMYVDLPHHFKGTHMSRFIEILNEYKSDLIIENLDNLLIEVCQKLEAMSAHIELGFKYFLEKEAPVSKAKSLMGYDCKLMVSHTLDNGKDSILEVKVPVMNLCPCSKEISNTAAHNQRGVVTTQVRFNDFVWIEDLISVVEKSASSELYTLLKRPDEKFVVEHAFDNPRFVEDVVRIVANELMEDSRVTWFTVKSINFESIHNHNAYAFIERDKGC